MTKSHYQIITLVLCCVATLTSGLIAQQPTATDSYYPMLQTVYAKKAEDLKFVLADESSTALAVRKEPVFSWTSLGGWSGDVFVWTGKGRIQMIGCIGSQRISEQQAQVFQELHCLTDEPVKDAKLDRSQTWQIPHNTMIWKPIPDAPPPASAANFRSIQMRILARTFKVGMQVTDDQVEQELRLLPQPLARETGGSEVIDSSLFCFVSSSGTDPEAFLILEARKLDEKQQWTYAMARFTTREIWMSRDGKELWRAAAIENYNWTQGIDVPYFFRWESIVDLADLQSAVSDPTP